MVDGLDVDQAHTKGFCDFEITACPVEHNQCKVVYVHQLTGLRIRCMCSCHIKIEAAANGLGITEITTPSMQYENKISGTAIKHDDSVIQQHTDKSNSRSLTNRHSVLTAQLSIDRIEGVIEV